MPPKCLDRDCVGRRRTGTRHSNVYRSVREKQGIVVYQQRVLQTVTSLRVVSLTSGDFTNQNATQPETSPEVICSQSASLRMLGAKLQRVAAATRLLHVQNTRLALAAFPENVSSFY